MCDKNSLEASTMKIDLIISLMARLSTSSIFMFNYNHHIKAMQDFSNQHSKTGNTVRSLGLIATCIWKTSSVQGLDHTEVAVELGLLLMNKRLVLVFLYILLYYFSTYSTLTQCSMILLDILLKLGKDFHHAEVAAKVTLFMVKYVDLVIFSFSSYLYLAECIRNLWLTATRSMMKTNSAKVLHHSGVAAKLDHKLMRKQIKKMMQKNYELYKKMQNPNFFLLRECYSYTRIGLSLVSAAIESFLLEHVDSCRIFHNSYSTLSGYFYNQSSFN